MTAAVLSQADFLTPITQQALRGQGTESFSAHSWHTFDMSLPETVTGNYEGEREGFHPYNHGLCLLNGHVIFNYDFDKQQEGQVSNE